MLLRGLDARTSTRTRWPVRRAAIAIAEPTKPLAPVTRRMSPAFGCGIAALPGLSIVAGMLRTRRQPNKPHCVECGSCCRQLTLRPAQLWREQSLLGCHLRFGCADALAHGLG